MTWKKNFSESGKLSARIKKWLLNVEDWKLLLTHERLLSTNLISNLNQRKRKETKGEFFFFFTLSNYPCYSMQTFTNFSFSSLVYIENMSTTKGTPVEITMALAEEISDEEGGLYIKKLRRELCKANAKADEKREK